MKYIPESLWREIEKLIPQKNEGVGRPEFDNKKVIDSISKKAPFAILVE